MNDPLDLSTQEPTRLLDDPTVDAGLRGDLEIASRTPSLHYPVDAGLARFEQTVAGASTVPPGGSLTGVRAVGWFAAAGVLIGAAALAWWLSGDDGELATAPARGEAPTVAAVDQAQPDVIPKVRNEGESVAGAMPSAAGEMALAHGSVAEAETLDGVADAPGVDPVEHAVSNPPRPAPKTKPAALPRPAPEPTLSVADEAKQIDAARKALATDPAETLKLTTLAEEQFPKGAMVQERRGYAILALVALDRRDEAERRADAYLERWPQGTLSRRVREALDR